MKGHSLEKFSYLKSSNVDYIDEIFERYSQDPDSVDPSWRYLFEGMELGAEAQPVPLENGHAAAETGAAPIADLINAYREFGRLLANINPLVPPPSSVPQLELSRFGLTNTPQVADLVARLKETYCGSIAVEYVHIPDLNERKWLQDRMESTRNRPQLEAGTRKLILERLTASEAFERFLHTRYVAQKRFSVEGGESIIPSLDCMIESGAQAGAREVVIGMAHRGRLNVLTNIFGKKHEQIFTQFEGQYKSDESKGEGDVKYHMGWSQDVTTRQGKKAHLSLAFNPSHLEFVGAVVEGMARAKQTLLKDETRDQVLPIVIHGDAAFAGQGVCYEMMQMSLLPGYTTGGTLHIVINNQVGFTTSPKDARSTTYATDGARMLDCPIFHVNGDDPEAVWYVSQLCTEYRYKFKKDAFIDLICYRKHGHNEGDEPSFTQPLLYKQIKTHPSTRELYAKKLVAAGVLSEADAQKMVDDFNARLADAQARTKAENPSPYVPTLEGRWQGLRRPTHEDLFKPVKTAVDEKTLKAIAEKINAVPAGFNVHPKLARFFEARLKAVHDGKGIDWGNGEALAYATLANEGHHVRITGQDAERGTFSHRHSVLNDFETGETYTSYNSVASKGGIYEVHNSFLSETAVMAFEYGYSLTDPSSLVIWEAQFGDFANGAQVIIDQFIAASESKWQRMSGLVLLLPHGYEGQGPEHSSARLERFLQLCGRDNIQVANFTTPANLFHAMRRQVLRDFRKPLVIMSPKSLLRHPMAVSTLDEFTKGGLQEVIDDPELSASPDKAKRVVLCSGKVYYDIVTERSNRKITDVAVVRVEQLYPWPEAALSQVLKKYSKAKSIVWAQEEPRNMGAWTYVFGQWSGAFDTFGEKIGGRAISYAGRDVGAAPAVGSPKVHEKEQKALVDKALTV